MADDQDFTEHDCTLDPSTVAGSGSSSPIVLNPDYVVPTNRMDCGMEFRVYFNATEYRDFAPHINAKSKPTIDENDGIISDILRISIEDTLFSRSNLPFELRQDLRVELVDLLDGYTRFHGTIAAIDPDPFLQRQSDLTDVRYLQVTCKDYTEALSNNPVTEAYQNVTESFVLSDMVGRYSEPLSNADMDTSMGDTVGRYVVMLKFPSQEFQSAMLRNDWVLWVDRETLRVQLKRRDDAGALVPTIVSDVNVNKLFNLGTFRVNRTNAAVNNRVIMPWQRAYRVGLADVAKDEIVVYISSTEANLDTVLFPGDSFRLEGSQSTYTIDKIVPPVSGPGWDIHLTSEFREETATGVGYVIISTADQPPIQIDDVAHQEAMAQIMGLTGELAGVKTFIAPQPAEPLTEEEAELVASQYLRTDVYEGGAKTNTLMFPWPVQAGQTIEVNRYNFRGILVFRKIRWTFRSKKAGKPVWDMDISFTDPIVDIDRQIRALLHERHRAKLQNDLKIRERKIVYERVYVGDCMQVVDARPAESQANVSDQFDIPDPEVFASEVDISDEFTTRETPSGPFYTSPVSPGHTEASVFGFVGFSRCT